MAGGFIRSTWLAAVRSVKPGLERTAAGALLACAALLGPSASAAPISIPIASYDIHDAVLSGHGGWAHAYAGKITPGVEFANGNFRGTTATYAGGHGTLNDGVIGRASDETQLFVAGNAPIRPKVSLALDLFTEWHVERVEIFGGDIQGNSIPGALTGLHLALGGPDGSTPSVRFLTAAFATETGGLLVNDLVDLAGTDLAGKAARTVLLSDFEGTFANWFSITEIRVYGTAVESAAIPLPGTLWLLAAALLALPVGRIRRSRGGAPR